MFMPWSLPSVLKRSVYDKMQQRNKLCNFVDSLAVINRRNILYETMSVDWTILLII